MSAITRGPDDLARELDAILASRPEAIADPFPVWRRLREAAPVHRAGPVTFVSRHADVKALMRSPALSNQSQFVGSRPDAIAASLAPDELEAHLEVSSFERKYVSRNDGDEHQRLRHIAHRAFTPRRVAEMRDQIGIYTDQLLEGAVRNGSLDVMADLAWTLPLMVITDMLDVPPEDREQIHGWSNLLGRNRGGDDPAALMAAHGAMAEFRQYVAGIIDERRRHPRTDLVGALMEAEQGDRLSEEELTAMFVILLFAGHETTTNLIGHGLHQLCSHPQQWEALRADPTLAVGATEELLRWVSPVQWIGRVAVDPVELDGHRIESGDTVYLVIAAANRDPDAFADPERLDITRTDARNHLALGFGPHFCLGNALARLEGAVVFERLARHYPDLRLETDAYTYRGHGKLRGLAELPVALGARRG